MIRADRFSNRVIEARNRAARWVGRVSGRKSNLVLFGARNGDWYMDNSRYLFEWMLANSSGIDCVWTTKAPGVLHRLEQARIPVVDLRSARGVRLLQQASAAVISNRLLDVAVSERHIPDSLRVVSLGHGQGVKGKRGTIRDPVVASQWRRRLERPTRLTRFAIATSPLVAKLTSASHLLPEERVAVTGYPRNDRLLAPIHASTAAWSASAEPGEPQRVILYAPTWRLGDVPTRFFPFDDFDQGKLVRMLRERRLLLLLRPHVMDLQRFAESKAFLERLASAADVIRIVSHNEVPDVNDVLPFVHVLISDYSSLYHDFLLLDRPMIFVPYDYREFEAGNGFAYPYYENLPGPAISSFAELETVLDSLSRDDDAHRHHRASLRDRIHTYQDAGASARVARLIHQVLEEPR